MLTGSSRAGDSTAVGGPARRPGVPTGAAPALTLLALGRLGDDELRGLQVGGRMHQHELLQVEILLLKLLQLLQILENTIKTQLGDPEIKLPESSGSAEDKPGHPNKKESIFILQASIFGTGCAWGRSRRGNKGTRSGQEDSGVLWQATAS